MNLVPFIPEKMLCKNRKYILGYKNGYLIIRNCQDLKCIKKNRIHPWYKSFTLFERLFRYEPRVAFAINDDKFVFSDCGAVYEYEVNTNIVSLQHSFSREMNNPLSFCIRKDMNGSIIDLIYGEYIWNEKKGPVSIYRYSMNEWKEIYSFPSKTVTHIHNIIYDKFQNRYIIMTGDDDSESALWEADEDFSVVKKIIGGKQCYRACVAIATKEGIYYATDTPLEQNWLYFLSKEGLKEVYKMPGPCIYGLVCKDNLYMATSVEGDPTLGRWRYRFSSKLGKGVRDRFVHIVKCDIAGRTEEIASFRKDSLPMWLFQFGNAQFVDADDGIYISTQSTKEKGTFKLVEV